MKVRVSSAPTRLSAEELVLRGLIDRRIAVEGPDFDYADASLLAYARSVAAALERSGRLLPPGGEVRTQWGIRYANSNGTFILRTREAAEGHMADSPPEGDYLAFRPITTWPDGTQLLGPWSPVVPDSEASDG